MLLILSKNIKYWWLFEQPVRIWQLVMNNAAKTFDILATSLSVLHNYFDSPNKIIFESVSN